MQILLAQISDVIRRKPVSPAGAEIELGSEKIEFKRSEQNFWHSAPWSANAP
jgi:hypothetical protein